MRRGFLALALLALVAGVAPAQAGQESQARVLVKMTGPRRVRAFRAVKRLLGAHGYQALRARAGPGELTREAARRGAALILAIELRAGRRGRRARLVAAVRDADGGVLARARLRARNLRRLRRRLRRRLWGDIGAAVERGAQSRGRSPAARTGASDGGSDPLASSAAEAELGRPPGAPDDTAVGVSRKAPASQDETRPPSALTLSVSGALVSRRFGYRDDLFGELRRYRADFRPGIAAGAIWHPAVHLDQGSDRLRRLGVAARYLFVPAFDTRTAEGERYPTAASSFRVGLRWRQPIGRLVLSGIADYAGRSFELEQGQALRRPEIPGVRYRLLRVGASARRPIADRWTAGGVLAYRHVLESGEIESTAYFSRSTALGVDGSLWVGRRLASRLDLRLSAALERYAYTLNPEPGDLMVAGGALDQYLTFSVALRYRDL